MARKYTRVSPLVNKRSRAYVYDDNDEIIPCTVAGAASDSDDCESGDEWNKLWVAEFSTANGGGAFPYRRWQLFANRKGCLAYIDDIVHGRSGNDFEGDDEGDDEGDNEGDVGDDDDDDDDDDDGNDPQQGNDCEKRY
jgi:hypothetical protein